MASERRIAIAISGVSKSFDGVPAVDDVSIDIAEGEFFSLLGPSGCGKTTTLRMIAGFVTPDAGSIVLQGKDVTTVSANRRPVNMVFQHYALFPHMTIYDNVAFGLKVKGVPRSEHRERIGELLRVVALARALVNRPAALLLDEPLGALDVKLRKQMQLELKRIQHELGTTFVYVTHDQDEALAMSDRIAVMNRGRVEQLATPREIYERPSSAFVADFVGSLNTLDLTLDDLVAGFGVARLSDDERVVASVGAGRHTGEAVRVGIRPEHVRLHAGDAGVAGDGARLTGTVAELVYLGMYTQVHVDTRAGRIVSHGQADVPAVGSPVVLTWAPEHASVLTASADV